MALLNGRLPESMLGKIPGSGVLFPLAFIPQVVALREAFEQRFGKPLRITDGYRPYSGNYYAQVETMLRRYKPLAEFRRLAPGASTAGRKSHVWNGERRYLLPNQAQVAFPGTSNHGRPDTPALDLGSGVNIMDSAEHRWVVANAPRFGFRWPEWWARAGREPWHIEAFGIVNVSDGVVIPSANIPLPGGALPGDLTPKDWFDMATEEELRRIVAEEVARLLPIGFENERPNLTAPMLHQANKAVAPVLDALSKLPDDILNRRIPGSVEGSASTVANLIRDARVAATEGRSAAIQARNAANEAARNTRPVSAEEV